MWRSDNNKAKQATVVAGLSFYTGARTIEICSLYIEDLEVTQSDEALFISMPLRFSKDYSVTMIRFPITRYGSIDFNNLDEMNFSFKLQPIPVARGSNRGSAYWGLIRRGAAAAIHPFSLNLVGKVIGDLVASSLLCGHQTTNLGDLFRREIAKVEQEMAILFKLVVGEEVDENTANADWAIQRIDELRGFFARTERSIFV
ncbi:Oidioi.mRNA.OKI2018_I69.YSR.g17114.t1.cds [Oikopleura dioica]|uniref:Oidioi.mRNA.OKI2018_I69.YSR.g17114.t1.cds n=1 Tax=Oikopleura dioica TaxID=34765 RepID=A0ABN7SSJ0_OIKDI|nr:Oidioi.mRNA.OKI2018_I69.YSR.g17114.t1.cds [Oikopleura dioica]